MTVNLSGSCPTAPAAKTPFQLWQTIVKSIAITRQRRTLRGLDATRLDDIGISRAEALAEADRPIWDVPTNWRQ